MPELNPDDPILCRVVASRVGFEGEWDFHLINDGDAPIDSAVLVAIDYEWGALGNREAVDAAIPGLGPGEHSHIWRDDGSGAELRMEFTLRVTVCGREHSLSFEFPKLYRRRELPLIEELGRHGYAVSAGGDEG